MERFPIWLAPEVLVGHLISDSAVSEGQRSPATFAERRDVSDSTFVGLLARWKHEAMEGLVNRPLWVIKFESSPDAEEVAMSFSTTEVKKSGFFYSTALTEVIHELEEIAGEMASDGFREEAATLKTTVDDLHWQYEEVIDKELAGQWPSGPRRPLRAPIQAG